MSRGSTKKKRAPMKPHKLRPKRSAVTPRAVLPEYELRSPAGRLVASGNDQSSPGQQQLGVILEGLHPDLPDVARRLRRIALECECGLVVHFVSKSPYGAETHPGLVGRRVTLAESHVPGLPDREMLHREVSALFQQQWGGHPPDRVLQ